MGTPQLVLRLLELAYDLAIREGWLGTAQAVSDASARVLQEQATAEGAGRAAQRSSDATSRLMAAARSEAPKAPGE